MFFQNKYCVGSVGSSVFKHIKVGAYKRDIESWTIGSNIFLLKYALKQFCHTPSERLDCTCCVTDLDDLIEVKYRISI